MSPVACLVDSPTRTAPGAAIDWTLLAVFTRSPATIPWFWRSEVHGGFAGEDARAGAEVGRADVRPQIPHESRELERGANGAFGVVLVRDRRSPHGHDGVADELLDHAAVALDDPAALVEVAREELPDVLGVARLRERREPDQIDEEHRDEAAFGRRDRLPSGSRRGPKRRPQAARRRSCRRTAVPVGWTFRRCRKKGGGCRNPRRTSVLRGSRFRSVDTSWRLLAWLDCSRSPGQSWPARLPRLMGRAPKEPGPSRNAHLTSTSASHEASSGRPGPNPRDR